MSKTISHIACCSDHWCADCCCGHLISVLLTLFVGIAMFGSEMSYWSILAGRGAGLLLIWQPWKCQMRNRCVRVCVSLSVELVESNANGWVRLRLLFKMNNHLDLDHLKGKVTKKQKQKYSCGLCQTIALLWETGYDGEKKLIIDCPLRFETPSTSAIHLSLQNGKSINDSCWGRWLWVQRGRMTIQRGQK